MLRNGRPAIIEHNGVRIYVAVHDEYYIRTWREWKNQLRLAHPDMSRHPNARKQHISGDTRFKRLCRLSGVWKKKEAALYAEWGLEPPHWGNTPQTATPPTNPIKPRLGSPPLSGEWTQKVVKANALKRRKLHPKPRAPYRRKK